MPIPPPTIDELVATIRRSSLPTIIVEGGEDVVIYRWMESILRDSNVDFLPCSARSTVLSVYSRRGEFKDKKVAFLADKDMWVLSSTPPEYEGVIFTAGYSIENDVLSCRAADRLFDAKEKASFDLIVATLAEWFAFEAEEWRDGRTFIVDVSTVQLLDTPNYSLSSKHTKSRGFRPGSGEVADRIRRDPLTVVRGKNILEGYSLILNAAGRSSRYSKRAILELCIKMPNEHPLCDRLISQIRDQLGI